MYKRSCFKFGILTIIIMLISLAFFFTSVLRNKHKKFVIDVFENYIILTDEDGRNITDEIKETYKSHYESEKYDFIFSKIKNFDYTVYYTKENNKLEINN